MARYRFPITKYEINYNAIEQQLESMGFKSKNYYIFDNPYNYGSSEKYSEDDLAKFLKEREQYFLLYDKIVKEAKKEISKKLLPIRIICILILVILFLIGLFIKLASLVG